VNRSRRTCCDCLVPNCVWSPSTLEKLTLRPRPWMQEVTMVNLGTCHNNSSRPSNWRGWMKVVLMASASAWPSEDKDYDFGDRWTLLSMIDVLFRPFATSVMHTQCWICRKDSLHIIHHSFVVSQLQTGLSGAPEGRNLLCLPNAERGALWSSNFQLINFCFLLCSRQLVGG
jgi:hypothetical protein